VVNKIANLIYPEEILTEFLRVNVSEVTRQGLSNRQSNDTQSYTATAGQTIFTITDKTPIVCINEVTINTNKIYKYIDYDIDLDANKITLKTGATLGDAVVIDYDYGSNWIYDDKPRDDLKSSSYPRISVIKLTGSERQRGLADDYYYKNFTAQIDVLAFKGQLCTISTETKEGDDVCKYIANDIITQIKTKWRSELKSALFNFNIISNGIPVPFEEGRSQFRRIIEISFDGED
jgi:hypothetical protein